MQEGNDKQVITKEGKYMDIAAVVREKMIEYDKYFKEDVKWFHENPELSFKEHQTTKYIKDRLEEFGVEILDIGMETGCVGYLKGAYSGPCIALRSDIDGLPIEEKSSSEHPSKKQGIMHACGHDIHMASLLGAARIMADLKGELHGAVKFLFQPGEEVMLGAKKFVEHKCLENPNVDAIFGLHNSPEVAAGSVTVQEGPLMAAVGCINITIKGRGGHGGIPQRNADPVVAAAAVIQSVQTIASRNISPMDSCVVSICSVKAGEEASNNITPDEVKMYGTVRTYRREVEERIRERLDEIISSVSEAYGCVGELEYIYELAVTENDPLLYEAAYQAVKKTGATPVKTNPSTGGEDFSAYLGHGIPGFFYWLGVKNEDKDCAYSWHSPHFKADDDVIATGAGVLVMSVFEAADNLGK